MATSVTCVSCARPFDVEDDDPRWSITTEVRDDGTEVVTSRFIEPSCPSCGRTTRWLPAGAESSGVLTEVTDFDGNEMHVNRIEVPVADDTVYDPAVPAFEQGLA